MRSKHLLGAVTVVSAIWVVVSCRSRSGDDGRATGPTTELDSGTFDKAALLRSVAECTVSSTKEFATAAAELDRAVRAAETDPSQRAGAQDAWKTAMAVWERLEVFQFGPAARTGSPGTRDMRDSIYGWPLVTRCSIEQTLHDKLYEMPDFGTLSLVSTRTLAALEYLLFYDPTDNGCGPSDRLNADGTWAAIGDAEIKKRKAAYARVVAADVSARAQKLADAWDPAKENFAGTFATAGPGNATYGSQQMAFNAVSDALFYVDIQVKNWKLGRPAGLTADCTTPPCLDAVESPFAKRSKEHIRANLDAYDQLFHGCGPGGAGLGFDDLLDAVGAAHVTTKIDDTMRGARTALDGLKEPTLEDDIQKNPAGVRALFDALRANASVMKAEFATVLDLGLPKTVEGDND